MIIGIEAGRNVGSVPDNDIRTHPPYFILAHPKTSMFILPSSIQLDPENFLRVFSSEFLLVVRLAEGRLEPKKKFRRKRPSKNSHRPLAPKVLFGHLGRGKIAPKVPSDM